MNFIVNQALGGITKEISGITGKNEEEKLDPEEAEKQRKAREEHQLALQEQEEERKARHRKHEAKREKVRSGIRNKYGILTAEQKAAKEEEERLKSTKKKNKNKNNNDQSNSGISRPGSIVGGGPINKSLSCSSISSSASNNNLSGNGNNPELPTLEELQNMELTSENIQEQAEKVMSVTKARIEETRNKVGQYGEDLIGKAPDQCKQQ